MTRPSRSSITLPAALLSLPLALAAQTPRSQPGAGDAAELPAAAWPVDRVFTDVPDAESVWAAAGVWKAGFTTSGVEFLTATGPDLPALRARFALRGIRCGGARLPTAPAGPELVGERVVYDRTTVVETFDLRPEGIEQRWRFDALPARGAIELELAVDTDLEITAEATGHRFGSPSAGIHYGRATAIDALGRRAALTTEWNGSALLITVPKHFVATATLPLLIDPLIGASHSTGASTLQLLATDIAVDDTLGRYFVTYERAYSATDHDVYLEYFDRSMQPIGWTPIDLTTFHWVRPRIATLESADRGCVVAQTSTADQSPFVARGRLFDGGGQVTAMPAFAIAGHSLADCRSPDIGGDADRIGASRFLVAYEQQGIAINDSGAWFRTIADDGTLSVASQLPTPIGFEQRVSVSKSCGAHLSGVDGWALVHRHVDYQAVTGRLFAWFVDRAGHLRNLAGPNSHVELTGATLNLGSDWEVSSPVAAPQGLRFLCAETRINPLTHRGVVVGHVVDANGNVLAADVTLASGGDHRRPSVDSDGCRFAMAHEAHYPGSDVDVQVTTMAFAGGQLLVHDTDTVSFDPTADGSPAICSARSSTFNRYGLAWINETNGTWTVGTRPYLGVGQGGFQTRTTGCGGLQTITLGDPRLGQSFAVGLTNPTGLHGFLFGLPVSLTIPQCPLCVLGVNGDALATSTLQVQVPTDPQLVGLTFAVQGWQMDPAGGPCLGEVSLGDTIDVTVQ